MRAKILFALDITNDMGGKSMVKKKRKRKLWSVIIVVLLLTQSIPTLHVNAAEDKDDYTVITTVGELSKIRNNLSGKYWLERCPVGTCINYVA